MHTSDDSRMITVDYLARVEGEGGLHVVLEGDRLEELELRIFEPPRFYEALLRGRRFSEAPDITARICGICPVAYQTSSINAMEHAAGVSVPEEIRQLRRLLYCGEWIESHTLHVFMLHAPDFLGYAGSIEMAKDHPDLVNDALRLKKLGNRIMSVVGGREIHPVNVRVGGFYRSPDRSDLTALLSEIEWALGMTKRSLDLIGGFHFPEFTMDYEFVALRRDDEYAITDGRIVSTAGIDIPVADWRDHFVEFQVAHSNALHARIRDRGIYHVGPLARYAVNADLLTPEARESAKLAGLGTTERNPFRSILVRVVEIVLALEEARRIIDGYEPPDPPFVAVDPADAIGHGASEAPRGILYHRYEIDDAGKIADAQIVPPTSQNQPSIEEDLRRFIPPRAELDDETLRWQTEQAIRNYDPCISCATHFLDMTIERR